MHGDSANWARTNGLSWAFARCLLLVVVRHLFFSGSGHDSNVSGLSRCTHYHSTTTPRSPLWCFAVAAIGTAINIAIKPIITNFVHYKVKLSVVQPRSFILTTVAGNCTYMVDNFHRHRCCYCSGYHLATGMCSSSFQHCLKAFG